MKGLISMKQGYRQLLKITNYRKVLLANFINRLGDAVDMIAFTWLSYQLTQSASWSAFLYAMNQLPPIVFMPFIGAFVEGFNKKQVIIICDCLRGLCTLATALLYITQVLNIGWLIVITFVNNTFECFRIPAANALLPQLLEKDQYEYGIAFNTSLSNTTELIGIALSGILLAQIGVEGAVFIDAASFFISSLIFLTLQVKEINMKKALPTMSAYLQTLKEGIHYISSDQLLKVLLGCSILCNAVLVPLNSYIAPFISGTLQLDEQVYAAFNFLITLGICIGTFLIPFLHQRIQTRDLFLYSFASVALYYAAMVYALRLHDADSLCIFIYSAAFLCGIGFGISCNVCSIAVMKKIDTHYLARVTSLNQAVSRSCMPLTSFLLSGLSLYFTIPEIFSGFAIFTIIAITGMMFSETLKQMQ